MYYHAVDSHIEEHGQCQPPLGVSVGFPELKAMESARPCDHLFVLPKISNNATHFKARSVSLQNV